MYRDVPSFRGQNRTLALARCARCCPRPTPRGPQPPFLQYTCTIPTAVKTRCRPVVPAYHAPHNTTLTSTRGATMELRQVVWTNHLLVDSGSVGGGATAARYAAGAALVSVIQWGARRSISRTCALGLSRACPRTHPRGHDSNLISPIFRTFSLPLPADGFESVPTILAYICSGSALLVGSHLHGPPHSEIAVLAHRLGGCRRLEPFWNNPRDKTPRVR